MCKSLHYDRRDDIAQCTNGQDEGRKVDEQASRHHTFWQCAVPVVQLEYVGVSTDVDGVVASWKQTDNPHEIFMRPDVRLIDGIMVNAIYTI